MAYYVRTKNLYSNNTKEKFKLSRSKIDLFISCPKCFYLDRKLGVVRPDFPSFNLNLAVDNLLKKEFDLYRSKNQKHPLMEASSIDALPFSHEKLNEWRHNFTGIQYHHPATDLLIFGAIDDLWINPKGELIIVDYKATSTPEEVSLDSEYKDAYKRQMEIYQWLFRQNGFKVSSTGFFVYCNGLADKDAFDKKLEFDIKVIPYSGNDDWVEPILENIKKCLDSPTLPEASPKCDFCAYRTAAGIYN